MVVLLLMVLVVLLVVMIGGGSRDVEDVMRSVFVIRRWTLSRALVSMSICLCMGIADETGELIAKVHRGRVSMTMERWEFSERVWDS